MQSAKRKISREDVAINNFVVSFRGPNSLLGPSYVSPPFWRVLHHWAETFQRSCKHKRNEAVCKISTEVDGIKSSTFDQSCWTSMCSSF